jgi:hypothetical protein
MCSSLSLAILVDWHTLMPDEQSARKLSGGAQSSVTAMNSKNASSAKSRDENAKQFC